LIVGVFLFLTSGHLTGDSHHWKLLLTIAGLDGFFLYKMQNYYLVGEWYTGYMLLTYLLFPFLLIGMRFNMAMTAIIVFAIFTVLYINYDKFFDVYINCNPLMRLPDFMFGMIYSKYIYNNKKSFYASGIVGALILVCLVTMLQKLPSQVYMLIFGCCIYSVLAMLFNLFKNIKPITKITSHLAGLTFIAFLLHHQIIYFLFGKLDYSVMTNMESGYFFFVICFMSLALAFLLKPVISRVEQAMKKLLLE